MQSAEHFESADEASDDEEEDGGWLAHSTFDLRPPPVSARQHEADRRPLSTSGFDVRVQRRGDSVPCSLTYPSSQDSFTPPNGQSSNSGPFEDPFDDVCPQQIDTRRRSLTPILQDTFGPFSDAAAASGSDQFTFASASAEEPEHLEDASFESFGDFGDFQSADSGSADGGGAGSWTLASSSSTGSLDEFGGGGSPQQKAERTQ